MDFHRPRRSFYLDTGASQLVQSLSLMLDRAVHRRNLLDAAQEGLQGTVDHFPGDAAGVSGCDHFAFGIKGSGGDPEPDCHDVSFG